MPDLISITGTAARRRFDGDLHAAEAKVFGGESRESATIAFADWAMHLSNQGFGRLRRDIDRDDAFSHCRSPPLFAAPGLSGPHKGTLSRKPQNMMHDVPADPVKPEALTFYHAVVWLDHHEARIIHFSARDSQEDVVRPVDPPRHLHIHAGSASGTHIQTEPTFYRDVAAACDEAQAVLLIGPSTAKTEFMTFLKDHLPQTAKRIAGVEPMGKLTDNQLLAEGRRYFAVEDRMTPQAP